MAEKRILGVKEIGIGDIAAGGGAATTFAALGVTYKGTAALEQTEAEDIEHSCEELDEPVEVLPGVKTTTISFGIIDFTPAALVKTLGGTVSGTAPNEKWEAPLTSEVIEKSVRITPKKGETIILPRVSLKARITYALAKEGIAQVLVTGRVLAPTDGSAPIIIG